MSDILNRYQMEEPASLEEIFIFAILNEILSHSGFRAVWSGMSRDSRVGMLTSLLLIVQRNAR